jgi:hypothetical protein
LDSGYLGNFNSRHVIIRNNPDSNDYRGFEGFIPRKLLGLGPLTTARG